MQCSQKLLFIWFNCRLTRKCPCVKLHRVQLDFCIEIYELNYKHTKQFKLNRFKALYFFLVAVSPTQIGRNVGIGKVLIAVGLPVSGTR